MKFCKILSLLVLLNAFSQLAMAGWKEAGGDSSIRFTCTNMDNPEAPQEIAGLEVRLGTGPINEVVLMASINGKIVVLDIGLFYPEDSKYEGDTFDIEFRQVSTIHQKAFNPIESSISSTSWACTWSTER